MNPLLGAIDTHVHSAPDTIPRRQDDFELARSAAEAGMRAIVLKSHHFSTAPRAELARRCVPDVDVIGGLVLNAASCGGLNPEAVQATFAVGGRIIWLPTISAENHLDHVRRGTASVEIRTLTSNAGPVPIVDTRRRMLPALDAVLDVIAAHDGVLATGHISPAETVMVVERALARGITHIVVTHPELALVGMSIDTQRQLAASGVFFERCYLNVLNGMPPAEMLSQIRSVGVETTILATDLGQAANPPAVVGMRAYHDVLFEVGMTDAEWYIMTTRNPAELLRLAGP